MSEKIEVRAGFINPTPVAGDKFDALGFLWEIAACDCYNNLLGLVGGNNRCGPHFINSVGAIFVFWNLNFATPGWAKDGVLIRQAEIKPISNLETLKTSNTRPQATHCAKCHGRLKDPGMGPTYKHCPKCEP